MNGITKYVILNWVVPFLMRQLAKFENGINWPVLKLDWEPRIRKAVPGVFLDNEVVAAVNAFIDAIDRVLSATSALESIVKLVVQEKFAEAWTELRNLILSQWSPSTPAEHVAYECVKDAESCPVFDLKSVSAA